MSKRLKKALKIIGAITGVAFVITSILGKKKKADSIYENDPDQKNSFEGKRVIFVEDESDKENADGVKGHLEAVGDATHKAGIYEKYIKRGMDVVLSFCGLVVLSPIMGAIALAIVIDDPGPVLFTQKRIGQNKQYFKLHKFRSMKMCTPHDKPTHMLDNPEQYITKVGKFIRSHSLDELPQIWDIFVGAMSVVGPRPALWNQDVLTAERDKYGANDIKPGLTGWAQINGRDELEIPDKAKLDGEYCKKLGPIMDVKVFLGSLHVFRKDDSLVEGGTGEMKKSVGRHYIDNKSDEELIGHIGFGEPVIVDAETEKRVLITGAGSYIGESFQTYAEYHYPALKIDTVDMIDGSWREKDFSEYDIVYHVAGIAHADVGNVDDATKEKYYAINTDLAIAVCKKAKAEGVKEFIFMSSMIVYGDSAPYGKKKVIDANTVPKAANFYGDSKLQADVVVRELADDSFKVLVLRPPMIYGKGSKGNYPTLAKLAKKLPVFPEVDNERSMLYIDNLCEFLCQIMLIKDIKKNAVVLIPQNAEWTKTSEMVKEIAKVCGKSVRTMKVMAPMVAIGGKLPGKIGGLVNKAFGNSCYAYELSACESVAYQKISLCESIIKSESAFLKTNSNVSPLVSIITVSYNSENTIRKTIESVLNQTYKNIEYRIVDGLSTDNTVEICREYERAFEKKGMRYIVTSEKDNGIYDAMNKGIFDSTGEIIGIINSDDWYENDAVETVVSNYRNTGFDYYYADINIIKSDGTNVKKQSKYDHIVTSRHWNHPSCFVTRATYDELGGFICEGIHDDFDFFLRVRRAEKKIVIQNKVLANFKIGGASNDKSFGKCRYRCNDRYTCYRRNGYSKLYWLECVIIEFVKFLWC